MPKQVSRSPIARAFRLIAVVAVVAAVAAGDCTNCSPIVVDLATVQVDLSFINPPPASIAPGTSGVLDVLVTRKNGFTDAVPINVTTQLFPDGTTWLTGDAVTVPAGETVAHVTYHVGANAPVSSAQTVDGSVQTTISGTLPSRAAWRFLVQAAGSFSLNTDITLFNLQPGTSVQSTINIVRQNYTGPVAFTATPVDGVSISFAPASTTGNSVVATIAAAADAKVTPVFPVSSSTVVTATGTGTGTSTPQSVLYAAIVRTDSYTLTPTPPTNTITVGSSGNETIAIHRDQYFGSSLILTATTTNAGITFTPVTVGSSSLTDATFPLPIAVGPSVPPGTYTVTVTGAASGAKPVTTTFQLQVTTAPTGSYTLTLQTAPLNVTAGSTSPPDTVTVARTNYTGSVSLAGTGPAGSGITVAVTAQPGTGNAGTLTVTVPSALSPGTYSVTLTGTSTLSNVTTTFAVVVASPVNTTWTFCPTSGLPVWVAVQDGGGAWTAITGSNNAYAFNISGTIGGIAYVTQPGTTDLHIFYGTKAELQAQGAGLCSGTGATKTVSGTVTNTGTAATGFLGLGSALAQLSLPGVPAFQLNNVAPGTLDLVGATVDGASPANPIKMFLRRNANLSGAIGALDFAGSESIVPTIKTLTPSTFDQGVNATYALQTSNGVLSTYFSQFVNSGSGPTFKVFGLPAASQVAGDLHYIRAQAYNGTGSTTFYRVAGVAVTTIADMPLSIGSVLNAPVVSAIATTPYARLRTVLTVQPEYNKLVEATYQQSFGSNRNVFIQMTGGYFGGAGTATLDIPDFTGVTGWTTTWGPLAGFLTHWIVTSSSWSGSNGIVFPTLTAGTTFNSATRQGDITP